MKANSLREGKKKKKDIQRGHQTSVSPNLNTILEYSLCLFLGGKEALTWDEKGCKSYLPQYSLPYQTVAGNVSVCNIRPQQIKGV